jgi:hypothetical protein
MRFDILGEISEVETFTTGSGHWYEAAGIGRKEFKIKNLL